MEKIVITGGRPLHGEVTVSGAKNAALYAISILALQDAALAARLADFRKAQAEKVLQTEL